ncbi:MAG: hypothetical protein L0Y44_06380 [Phycisphaerales bacterium]|nr:hypothetical protein [Phycisphaerales bacterium]
MTICTSPIRSDADTVWATVHSMGAGFFLVEEAPPQAVTERIFPPIATLKRIWEASDKSWIQGWLAADGDETEACDD